MKKNSSSGNEKIIVWSIVGVLVLLTAGIIYIGAKSSPSGTNVPATTVPELTSADHVTGDTTNAKVTVIEYGDFECPACGAYYPVFKQLIKDYGDRVEFAFRNFPLYQVHPNAGVAAQAAEAAALQGKYWEMHDTLYEKQNEWANDSPDRVVADYLEKYARSLGLDTAKFNADMNSDAVKNKISADVASANAAQVDHTPTFFVDLTQIANPANYDDFKSVIDKALSAS